MGLLDGLFGAPKPQGGSGEELVKAREFDITQYGKRLTVLIAVLVPAIVAALKALGVKEISEAMVIASLAVTAVAIFCATLVIAVDMIARAMVTRNAAAAGNSTAGDGRGAPQPDLKPGETRTTKTKTVSRG